MKNVAPLVVFVYKRLEYTKNMLRSVNENRMAGETDLFIFADGPKTKAEEEKVNEVRKYIKYFVANCNFRNVSVIESESNKGLAASVISGVTEVIQKYGKVIVVEDDLQVSNYFLDFMNDCLNFYAGNPKIWSIGGTSLALKALKGYKHDVYACYRATSTGWATWYDRWNKIDWDIIDYEEFMKDRKRKRRFKKAGNDVIVALKNQREGKTDSWAIRWCYNQSKEKMYTILPVANMVKISGWGEDATHCDVDRFHTQISDKAYDYYLEDVTINEKIMKDFRKYYSRPLINRIVDFFYLKYKAITKRK